ncbi:MAG: CAP domain-containing protein, partial [Verrucomicrobiaceae bacterium]
MRSLSFFPNLSFRLLSLTVWGVLFVAGASVTNAITLTSQEQALASSLTGSSGQNRPFLRLDPTLTQVARSRAADMARRGYFAHVNPDGKGPNQLIREAGYPLPEWWGTDRQTNYVESIAAGRSSASATWSDFMNSAAHKKHLLAESDFYQEQTSFGIGHVSVPGSKY